MNRGPWGEEVAAQWLRGEGFEVLARNWRAGRYEIDIVARRGGAVHFVEVKTRKADGLTAPEDALTPAKFRSLQRAARAWLALHRTDAEVQFDLAAVEYTPAGHTVRYIPNAMVCRW
jgi:putative endonuclease